MTDRIKEIEERAKHAKHYIFHHGVSPQQAYNEDVPFLLSELTRLQEDNASLRNALQGLSNMYTHAWDLVQGGLIMLGDSVGRFDEAHRMARIALGEPLYGDLGEVD